eukprot:SAG25_NODE_90_length_16264_cov_230.399876_7_plen_807_part_00
MPSQGEQNLGAATIQAWYRGRRDRRAVATWLVGGDSGTQQACERKLSRHSVHVEKHLRRLRAATIADRADRVRAQRLPQQQQYADAVTLITRTHAAEPVLQDDLSRTREELLRWLGAAGVGDRGRAVELRQLLGECEAACAVQPALPDDLSCTREEIHRWLGTAEAGGWSGAAHREGEELRQLLGECETAWVRTAAQPAGPREIRLTELELAAYQAAAREGAPAPQQEELAQLLAGCTRATEVQTGAKPASDRDVLSTRHTLQRWCSVAAAAGGHHPELRRLLEECKGEGARRHASPREQKRAGSSSEVSERLYSRSSRNARPPSNKSNTRGSRLGASHLRVHKPLSAEVMDRLYSEGQVQRLRARVSAAATQDVGGQRRRRQQQPVPEVMSRLYAQGKIRTRRRREKAEFVSWADGQGLPKECVDCLQQCGFDSLERLTHIPATEMASLLTTSFQLSGAAQSRLCSSIGQLRSRRLSSGATPLSEDVAELLLRVDLLHRLGLMREQFVETVGDLCFLGSDIRSLQALGLSRSEAHALWPHLIMIGEATYSARDAGPSRVARTRRSTSAAGARRATKKNSRAAVTSNDESRSKGPESDAANMNASTRAALRNASIDDLLCVCEMQFLAPMLEGKGVRTVGQLVGMHRHGFMGLSSNEAMARLWSHVEELKSSIGEETPLAPPPLQATQSVGERVVGVRSPRAPAPHNTASNTTTVPPTCDESLHHLHNKTAIDGSTNGTVSMAATRQSGREDVTASGSDFSQRVRLRRQHDSTMRISIEPSATLSASTEPELDIPLMMFKYLVSGN